jgi:8-oxo-dGTP pyrophosphatase MutT (NUDIX family)
MSSPIRKVTCFITRVGESGTELLVFNHPGVGVQIPAGTVEPGEKPETSARREAAEETGLVDLLFIRSLGEQDDPPPQGSVLIAQPTLVYSRPDSSGYDWAHLHPGLTVEMLRHFAGFTQVRFEETDRYIDPQFVTYNITGWVPDEALTGQCIRHYYLFSAPTRTPERWSVVADYTIFELFWAPVNNLPLLVHPQDGWIKRLPI